MPFAPVIALLGWLVASFSVTMLVPAGVAAGQGELRAAVSFGGTAAVTLFFGVGMIFATQGASRGLRRGGDFLLAVIAWPVLAGFGAVPFLLLDVVASPADAFFESLSGLTTTGATVIPNLEQQMRSVLIWRAWLQWLGGLGTIVLAVTVLPMLGVGGMQMFYSAMPHGDHATFEARVRRSALALGSIYAVLTLICVLALRIFGMPAFDAFAHALSTISTGGFSTRDAGVAAFDNPRVEAVLVVFMLLGALNFTLYWALANRRPAALWHDPEFRLLLVVTVAVAAVATAVFAEHEAIAAPEAARRAIFATVSLITTTGFVNEMTKPWPVVLPILFLALVFIGGSCGSTSGGIKIMRLILAAKQGRRELQRLAHPHVVSRIRFAGRAVPEPVIQALWAFFILYMVTFAVLAVALSAFGLDAEGAVAMALATLTNSGAGLSLMVGGETDYATLPQAAKWVLSLGMLLGRLELVAVVAVLTPVFWRR